MGIGLFLPLPSLQMEIWNIQAHNPFIIPKMWVQANNLSTAEAENSTERLNHMNMYCYV